MFQPPTRESALFLPLQRVSRCIFTGNVEEVSLDDDD